MLLGAELWWRKLFMEHPARLRLGYGPVIGAA